MPSPHSHLEIEANWLHSGSLSYLFGGNRVDIAAGEWALFWGSVPHQLIPLEEIAVEGLEDTEGAVYFLAEGSVGEVEGDEEFDPRPEVFDLVQVGGVAGQRKQGATSFFDQSAQLLHRVEGRVIQNHDLPRQKRRAQLLLKPRLDERAVAVALEGERRQHLASTPSRRHRDTLGLMAQPFAQAPGSLAAPPIGVAQGVVYSGFVHIHPRFNRHTF